MLSDGQAAAPGAISSHPSRGQALGRHEMTSGPCCDTGSPWPGERIHGSGLSPPLTPGSLPHPSQTSHGHCLAGEGRNPRGPHYLHTQRVKALIYRASTQRPKAEHSRRPRLQPRSAPGPPRPGHGTATSGAAANGKPEICKFRKAFWKDISARRISLNLSNWIKNRCLSEGSVAASDDSMRCVPAFADIVTSRDVKSLDNTDL